MDDARNRRRWWVLAVLCPAVFLVSLDVTVLNIALPEISGALGATTAQLQWIVNAYTLAYAASMLPAGLLGDRLGTKRVILAGMVLFGAASALAAVSPSVGVLIAARALQGIGAAILLSLSLAIVTTTFAAHERVRAIGVFTAAVGAGMPLGPLAGGLLLENYSWSSVFWINVPLVALCLAIGVFLLREQEDRTRVPIDFLGTALSVLSVVVLIYAFIEAPERGWSSGRTLTLTAVALVAFTGFVRWERRVPHPLVPGSLFRDRRFTGGSVAAVVTTVPLIGILFTIPQYFQAVLGERALEAGLRLTPMMGGLLVGGALSSRLDGWLGTKTTILSGLILNAAGLFALGSITVDRGYPVVVIGLIAVGLGFGITTAAAISTATTAVGNRSAGLGSAVINTLRQFGGAFAVAILGSVLSATYADRLAPALRGLPAATATTARGSIVGANEAAATAGDGLRHAAGVAFAAGVAEVMVICGVVVLAGGVLCAWLLPGRRHRLPGEKTPHATPDESAAADAR